MEWQRPYRHNCGSENSSNRGRHRPVILRLPTALLALAAITILGLGLTAPCHGWSFGSSSPEEEAYEKSRDEFEAVHESVSTTKDSVENAKKAMDVVVDEIDSGGKGDRFIF